MRTQAPVREHDSAARQPSADDVERLRETAERIDDLLTDAKSALDRLMAAAVPERPEAVEPESLAPEPATVAMVADLLLEDPIRTAATNEFELDFEAHDEPAPQSPAAAVADEVPDDPSSTMHHDVLPVPRHDGRGVLLLAMVSMALLSVASLLDQHLAGLGVLGGANLLAWLVVMQQRRDASEPAAPHH
ncbi:MAG: hypothetical protein MUC36_18835 [Planctomycetes bacterium]|jgi:hypothetical protein|nr:hypothetical protein [Planctomycetota bacterium]